MENNIIKCLKHNKKLVEKKKGFLKQAERKKYGS